MSIIKCGICEKQVDCDFNDVEIINDKETCEDCATEYWYDVSVREPNTQLSLLK